MVKKVIKFMNREISGLHEAAYLLGIFALFSQFLALVRDRLLAATFGAGQILDSYYAAFRIPDAIFVTVASFVSASILIPFIVDRVSRGQDEARKFVNSVFTVFSGLIVVVSAVVFWLTPYLVTILFPGFKDVSAINELVLLTRIMLLQPILLGVSNFVGSIVQTYRQFLVYAIAPLLYNIGIILGVTWFYPKFGLSGLAWGVVVGAFLHLFIQIPAIIQSGLFPGVTFKVDWSEIKKVVKLSLPRTVALSCGNISTLLLISMASLAGAGSIAIFTLSWNLQSVPLSIIGASYSMAAFPTLAKLFSNGNRVEFLKSVELALRHILFWSMPVLVLFIVLRAQIVRTVLGFGQFDWSDTKLTAASLAIFAFSAAAQAVTLLLVRAYYAGGKTARPLFINLFSAVLTVVLGFVLGKLFQSAPAFRFFIESVLKVADTHGTEVLVFPLAFSISSILNAGLLWGRFEKDFGKLNKELIVGLWQSFAASVVMGLFAYIGLNIFNSVFDLHTVFGIFAQGALAGVLGIIAWVVVLFALDNLEIREVWKTLHGKIFKAKVVGPDSTDNPTL